MDVLCFDIGSGGVRGARFNEDLQVSALHTAAWNLHRDTEGRATLSVYDIECAFLEVAQTLAQPTPVAVSIGCFMHSYLVLSSCCAALTPVFTWLDTTAPEGIDAVRRKIGNAFHDRTGCHYHPMFPVFKLAANPPGRGNRVGSPKAWLAWELTGNFVEDYGMASASGLLDVRRGHWDSDLLSTAGLENADLPEIVVPDVIVGITTESGSRFGIPMDIPLVIGSGDGFLANAGSACTTPERICVTLGTSGAARQMVSKPALNAAAGTFCYRATTDAFLLGCATSNGGNVLEWARESFGPMTGNSASNADLPVFLPFMNGERSLEWNPHLRESWHGRLDSHRPAQLSRAVTEGVLFNIAQYVEVVERESGVVARDIVLSGNGFQDAMLARLFASVLGREVLLPQSPGLATLRGAAVHAWNALGHDVASAMENEIQRSAHVEVVPQSALSERFARFKEARRLQGRSE
jgi:gluconokinase